MEQMIEQILKFAITIFTTMNPLGAIPFYLSMTKDLEEKDLVTLRRVCSIAVTITLLVSMLIGEKLLGFFGISIASFRIGGGLLIFTMAFSMISAKASATKLNSSEIREQIRAEEIGIVPLAIPLLAGPGTITTTIIHAQHFTSIYHWIGASLVCVAFGFLVLYILAYGRKIGDKIGVLGLNVFTRIMGIILLALSIEMIVGGLKDIIPILKTHL